MKCPDCGRAFSRSRLKHDQTCPMGLGMDEVSRADREFFEKRPNATYYYRPPHWTEIAELKLVGEFPDVVGEPIGQVKVTSHGPGVRTRSFDHVAILLAGVGA